MKGNKSARKKSQTLEEIEKVLDTNKNPMSSDDIHQAGKFPSLKGKTPERTIEAKIYTDIKNANSNICQPIKGKAKFQLKKHVGQIFPKSGVGSISMSKKPMKPFAGKIYLDEISESKGKSYVKIGLEHATTKRPRLKTHKSTGGPRYKRLAEWAVNTNKSIRSVEKGVQGIAEEYGSREGEEHYEFTNEKLAKFIKDISNIFEIASDEKKQEA